MDRGNDRIWLKSYPPGVPAEVDYRSYRSLGDLFEKSVAQYRDRPAFHRRGMLSRQNWFPPSKCPIPRPSRISSILR